MAIEALIALAGLQLMLAMSPGPATVITIKTASSNGLAAGLSLSFGLATGVLIWALAALTGLSLIFELAPYLQTALRIAGGLFLIWIGISLWRHAKDPLPDTADASPMGLGRAFRLGVYTDLANPKALAYFAAVFSGVIPAEPTISTGALILSIIFVIEMGWYALVSLVFSRPTPQKFYRAAKSVLDRAFGGLIALSGAKIATSP